MVRKLKTTSKKTSTKKNTTPKRKAVSNGHLLWNMSRSIRDLDLIKSLLPLFKDSVEGEIWNRNKKIQNKLRKKLQTEYVNKDSRVKIQTNPKSKNPGDMRTRGNYLQIHGSWYSDENNKVVLTQSGKEIVDNPDNFYLQMWSQILRFQYPNPYHVEGAQKMDSSFKIFPYRFIVKLLLDKQIQYLDEYEIAYFVLKTKNQSEFSQIVKDIIKFRELEQKDHICLRNRKNKKGNYLIDEFNKKYRKSVKKSAQDDPNHTDKQIMDKKWKYSLDLAQTFQIHLRLFGNHFVYKSGTIRIIDTKYDFVVQIIKKYDETFKLVSFSQEPKSIMDFYNNYGMKFSNMRAARPGKKAASNPRKRVHKVVFAVNEIQLHRPSLSKSEIIEMVSKFENMGISEIKKIISKNSGLFNFGELDNTIFEKEYRRLSVGGTKEKTTVEFENATRNIFKHFGFKATNETISNRDGGHYSMEIFLINGTESAIVDTKSYGNGFTCSHEMADKMVQYVNKFKDSPIHGKKYDLTFFAYVYGKKFSNESNFDGIISQTEICGSRISADELLILLKNFDEKKISKKQIWKLFQKNGEITSLDF